MGNFSRPRQEDIASPESFGAFVLSNQSLGPGGPPRTTASISGEKTYAATSFNMSDILQGSYAVKDNSDQLLVINHALSKDLNAIYNSGGDSISSFSTAPPASSLSGGSGPGGSGVAGQPGGQVKQEWVDSLPKEHPTTKALIWQSSGKASREMHLPTSDDLAKDVSLHMQASGMKAEWKHPWNMDRVGGRIGGDGGKIYTNVADASSILGEDAQKPGQNGAFGFLDPASEQYYCSMAWPYKGGAADSFRKANLPDIAEKCGERKKSDYAGKRVLVYSVEKGTACVCTPGDWGPQPYWSNGAETRSSIKGFIIGLSPDTHFALGTDHGAEIKLGWVDDTTPLGPYAPTAEQAVNPNPAGGTGAPGGIPTTASTTPGNVKIEDLQYASQKILNHPNCWMGKDGVRIPAIGAGYSKAFRGHMTDGNGSSTEGYAKFVGPNGRAWLYPSLLNYLWYILEAGFILDVYLGSIGYKRAAGDQTRVSYHAYGGAIDIGGLGIASENKVYGYTDTANWRRVNDKLFNLLCTYPENTKPREVGSSFAYMYPNNYKVIKDANPTHIHIGYKDDMTGTLIPALKKPTPGSGGGGRGVA